MIPEMIINTNYALERNTVIMHSPAMMAPKAISIPPFSASVKTLDELLLSQASSTGAWNDINLVISFFKNAIEVERDRAYALSAVTDVS